MISTTPVFTGHLHRFRQFLRHHEMLLGGEQVLVAVSGGIDSMSLLDMLVRLAPALRLQIGVAHFDHGLRGEASRDDASFVVERARHLGLKFFVGHGDVPRIASEGKLSVEEAARRARYTFLKRVAKKHRYTIVMTGHTADDNAETLLLNLMRGSGVRGLAAIPPMRSMGDGLLLARPLLQFQRNELEQYASATDLAWREDETNVSPKFLRNRVRHQLLPLLKEFNPSIVNTLNSTADIMRNLEQYLSQSVEVAIQRVVVERTKERLSLNLHQVKHYLPAMQTEIVQRSISQAFDMQPISFGATERVLALVFKETGSRAEIGSGLTVLRDRETLVINRELPPAPAMERAFGQGDTVELARTRLRTTIVQREDVQYSRNSRVEYFDADKLAGDLLLRPWHEGDRFRPLGLDGEKKISDFLVDQKVPRDKKRHVMVVCSGEDIVWVCGMRIDDRYKVVDTTQKVLKMEVKFVSGSH